METMRLTGVILTYNESQHIVDCIASLRFADHIGFDRSATTARLNMTGRCAGDTA
jgi:hypothetical protein